MVTIPELHGYVTKDGSINLSDTTQARRLSEVPSQARDFICTVTDAAPSKVSVDITVAVDDIDVTAAAEKVNRERELSAKFWVCRSSGPNN